MEGVFNCLILGENGVGKTSFINRLKTGVFEEQYDPSPMHAINDNCLDFNTTFGKVTIRCLEPKGSIDLIELNHCIPFDCAIVMSPLTIKSNPLRDHSALVREK